MTTATIKEKQLTKFAEHVYEEQKEDFVQDLARRIKKSVDTGMTQIKNGQLMSLDESKNSLYQEFFNKSNNAKI